MAAIEQCRTAALGGHVAACHDCSHTRIAYNSCRNRFIASAARARPPTLGWPHGRPPCDPSRITISSSRCRRRSLSRLFRRLPSDLPLRLPRHRPARRQRRSGTRADRRAPAARRDRHRPDDIRAAARQPTTCPHYGGLMAIVETFLPWTQPRAPPSGHAAVAITS
jgi:hypothetical protein